MIIKNKKSLTLEQIRSKVGKPLYIINTHKCKDKNDFKGEWYIIRESEYCNYIKIDDNKYISYGMFQFNECFTFEEEI